MKRAVLIAFVFALIPFFLFSYDVIVQRDNGIPRLTGYVERYFWEESKIIKPDGPCVVKKVLIYYVGDTPNTDTIYIVGDPSEGYLPPTLWVVHYNQLTSPVVFNYPGKPGWYEFEISNVVLGGLDRIVIQHRLNQKGPWFAIDSDGISTPYSSFLMNPFENNSLGGPGNFYLASGDFLVRIVVEYLYPKDSTSEKPPYPTFVDVTKESGLLGNNLDFIRYSDASVVDWNGDGLDDIAIGSYFFQNNGEGNFSNVSSQIRISASATSWGDFNNDGNIDCYALLNGVYNENTKMVVSQDRLYKNNGDGSFTAIAPRDIFKLPYPSPAEDFKLPNPWTQDSIPNPYSCITPLWSDFNRDGRLDLFLANNRVGLILSGSYVERYFPDQLWIQDNDGKFKNITKDAGFSQFELFNPSYNTLGYYDCYGANACDYNNDGLVDIFVANYRLERDLLYKNNGNQTFTNVGDVTNVQGVPTASSRYFGHGMGCEWGDFNNDGYPDLAVGNLGHPDWRGAVSNPSLIFKNGGPPNFIFQEVHIEMGLKFFEMNAGVTWGDFDLDGYLDLWHGQISYRAVGDGGEPKRPGRIYLNSGPPNYRLLDKTWEFGCVVHGPWNAVRIDFDNDGDLDLLIASSHEGVRLFRNDLERKGNWVGFRLKGSPENNVNMDCYGSKIILYAGGRKYYRDLMGSISGNRCSQNSNVLHFGIGNSEIIDSIVVVYPNGFSKTYKSVLPNQYYLVNYNQNLIRLKLATPQCIYPKNFQFVLSDSIDFTWTKLFGNIMYQLLIDDNKDFRNPRVYLVDSQSIRLGGFIKSKQYYWKLRAISSDDTSFWSTPFSFFVGNPKPSKISLVAPSNNSTKLDLTPILVWNKPTFEYDFEVEIYYEVQISTTSNFKDTMFLKSAIKDTFLIVPSGLLSPKGKYFWRVGAFNIDGEGVWSDVFSFQTNSLPEKIVLVSPLDNSSDMPLKPTFRWKEVENVDEYVLRLSRDPNFDTVEVERRLQATLYKHLNALQPNTTYYWQVCGKNNVGNGPWSDTWSFKTTSASNVEFQFSKNVIVKPNPFTNRLFVECPKCTKYNVKIFDELGNLILSLDTYEEMLALELANLNVGVYLLVVQNENIYNSCLIFKFVP